jgi:hypothetical protein
MDDLVLPHPSLFGLADRLIDEGGTKDTEADDPEDFPATLSAPLRHLHCRCKRRNRKCHSHRHPLEGSRTSHAH